MKIGVVDTSATVPNGTVPQDVPQDTSAGESLYPPTLGVPNGITSSVGTSSLSSACRSSLSSSVSSADSEPMGPPTIGVPGVIMVQDTSAEKPPGPPPTMGLPTPPANGAPTLGMPANGAPTLGMPTGESKGTLGIPGGARKPSMLGGLLKPKQGFPMKRLSHVGEAERFDKIFGITLIGAAAIKPKLLLRPLGMKDSKNGFPGLHESTQSGASSSGVLFSRIFELEKNSGGSRRQSLMSNFSELRSSASNFGLSNSYNSEKKDANKFTSNHSSTSEASSGSIYSKPGAKNDPGSESKELGPAAPGTPKTPPGLSESKDFGAASSSKAPEGSPSLISIGSKALDVPVSSPSLSSSSGIQRRPSVMKRNSFMGAISNGVSNVKSFVGHVASKRAYAQQKPVKVQFGVVTDSFMDNLPRFQKNAAEGKAHAFLFIYNRNDPATADQLEDRLLETMAMAKESRPLRFLIAWSREVQCNQILESDKEGTASINSFNITSAATSCVTSQTSEFVVPGAGDLGALHPFMTRFQLDGFKSLTAVVEQNIAGEDTIQGQESCDFCEQLAIEVCKDIDTRVEEYEKQQSDARRPQPGARKSLGARASLAGKKIFGGRMSVVSKKTSNDSGETPSKRKSLADAVQKRLSRKSIGALPGRKSFGGFTKTKSEKSPGPTSFISSLTAPKSKVETQNATALSGVGPPVDAPTTAEPPGAPPNHWIDEGTDSFEEREGRCKRCCAIL